MTTPSAIDSTQTAHALLSTQRGVFQLGKLLVATVLRSTPDGQSGGNTHLRLGKETLPIRSSVGLTKGDILNLQVMRVHPQTLLSITSINGQVLAKPPDLLATHLLHLQPQQDGLPKLLSVLNSMIGANHITQLPPPLNQFLRQLFNALPTRNEIFQAYGLSEALANSGLFLEHKLARRKETPLIGRDLKGLLLRLLNRLPDTNTPAPRQPLSLSDSYIPPAPPNRDSYPTPQAQTQFTGMNDASIESMQHILQDAARAVLARLVLHQLTALEHTQDKQMCWLVEIPVRGNNQLDVLHLRIEKEPQRKHDSEASRWTATLAFDLPSLGPIQARVNIQRDLISSSLWAERKETASMLEGSLSTLRKNLEARGLRVRSITCCRGVPPFSTVQQNRRTLLNTKA